MKPKTHLAHTDTRRQTHTDTDKHTHAQTHTLTTLQLIGPLSAVSSTLHFLSLPVSFRLKFASISKLIIFS